ncbi:MAG TPA: cytochrome P450 [Labilithrix sp.]|nr:cytochrome P450 [Labilithrix sp.]
MDASELTGPRGRLRNTYRFLSDPYATTLAWRDRFGDPFLARTVNGDVVMTGAPEHLKAIFAAPPETYEPFGTKAIAPVVGARSLLILGGEAHRRERKLLMPPFHGSRMRAYAETMRDVAARTFALGVDRETTFQELAQHITLEIIVRAIFGVEDAAEVAEIGRGVLEVIDAVHPAFLFAPWLQRELGGLGPYARFRRAFERGDADLQRLIEARRTRGEGDDVLGLMLAARYEDGTAMADSDVRDELRTLVVAGHETSAMTLAFLVDRLFRQPEQLARAREEAIGAQGGTSASLASLPYLDAVVKETLRVRPIVTEAMRTLRAPLALGDLVVPAGMHVGASVVLAHYDPLRFPEPAAFRPERFLERTYGPTDYLPFGGGHRRCIGAAFADMEIRIIVATLLAGFDVSLGEREVAPAVRRNLTMGPKGGVPVRLARRVGPS